MKTIKQSQEVAFNAISFRDAIVLLSIMDELTRLVNYNRAVDVYKSLPQEEQAKYRKIWKRSDIHVPHEQAEQVLELLRNLGFESQVELKEPTTADLELN